MTQKKKTNRRKQMTCLLLSGIIATMTITSSVYAASTDSLPEPMETYATEGDVTVEVDPTHSWYSIYGEGAACVDIIDIDGIPLEIWHSTVAPSKTPYQCDELVDRYYMAKYGTTVRYSADNYPIAMADNLYFVETDDPQPGDIVYWAPYTSYLFGEQPGHVALVVEQRPYVKIDIVEQNNVSILELNKRASGSIKRTLDIESDKYTIFHPILK